MKIEDDVRKWFWTACVAFHATLNARLQEFPFPVVYVIGDIDVTRTVHDIYLEFDKKTFK